ncbi:hypothetical protein [Promicromonospora kroppenstedtii]|uniref:hypothetical protein n=1 Tax=Promicromonospora kroppenstedtii TaxID=440482 RepID=UPI003CCC3A1D
MIEVGDGQVSDLPAGQDPAPLVRALGCWRSTTPGRSGPTTSSSCPRSTSPR